MNKYLPQSNVAKLKCQLTIYGITSSSSIMLCVFAGKKVNRDAKSCY